MDELREFRGYVNGKLKYTFPWHWVDSIKPNKNGMLVWYEDEMQYDTENDEPKFVEIYVDFIDVK